MYAVFLFPSEAAGEARDLVSDDLVSRQSVTLRDAAALGSDLEGLVVVIEGQKAAAERFAELAGEGAQRLAEKQAAAVYKLLKQEEEDAAEGVGFLFG